jgi:hypothetical protein
MISFVSGIPFLCYTEVSGAGNTFLVMFVLFCMFLLKMNHLYRSFVILSLLIVFSHTIYRFMHSFHKQKFLIFL